MTKELEVAIALARKAGQDIMRTYEAGFSTTWKENETPVTEADHAANKIIVEGLKKEFPYPILSEESADDPARLESEYVWIVDPLDGTNGFVSRTGEFTVLIGLCRQNEPLIGVVYRPATDELYFAETGSSAFKVKEGRGPERLSVTKTEEPAKIKFLASDKFGPVLGPGENFGLLDPGAVARFGIKSENISRVGGMGLKIALIAEGKGDLCLNLSRRGSEWDTCAPEVVLHEAGGKITDVYGKKLLYNQKDVRRLEGGVISNGTAVHERAVKELALAMFDPGTKY